jgi:hypothetical protein
MLGAFGPTWQKGGETTETKLIWITGINPDTARTGGGKVRGSAGRKNQWRNQAMNESIMLTKTAFVKLLDALYPRDDDPGPWGPAGPVIRWTLGDLSWALLNPQPLPPRTGASHDPWRLGPQPDPWRLAVLARTLIDRVVTQYQFAEVAGAIEQSEQAMGHIRSYIREIVEDWCGTRPPKWPWPWPPRFDAAQLRPIDLLVAGAQFQKAAALDNPLTPDFSAAADRLIETGLKRMERMESSCA